MEHYIRNKSLSFVTPTKVYNRKKNSVKIYKKKLFLSALVRFLYMEKQEENSLYHQSRV